MKLSAYLRMPIENLPYDHNGKAVWSKRDRVKSMYRALSDKHTSLPQLTGASKAAKANASSLFEWILARTDIHKGVLPRMITSHALREKAQALMTQVDHSDIKRTRYEPVRSRSMTVCEDGHYIPMDGQDFVSLEDYRYGRVRYLMEQGVSADVLRAVVLDRVGRDACAVEALGLLTEVRALQMAEAS